MSPERDSHALCLTNSSRIQRIRAGTLFANPAAEGHTIKPVAALLGVIAIALAISSNGIAQTPGATGPWTYAYLVNTNGYGIEVAYLESDRCRIEEFHMPVKRANGFDIDHRATRIQSAAAAMNALVRDRWEMVGQGFAYCHYGTEVEAIHFKRR